MVSELHRNMLKTQEEAGGKLHSACITRTLSLTKYTLTVV